MVKNHPVESSVTTISQHSARLTVIQKNEAKSQPVDSSARFKVKSVQMLTRLKFNQYIVKIIQ